MMIQHSQQTFRALADPTRRDILMLLSEQDMTIAQVSDQFDMTRAAVKKHLTVLHEGDLIRTTPRGREKLNALNPDGLRPVLDWLAHFEQFWDSALDNLKTTLETGSSTND